jgi:hypothetical protein|tara:strand:+ start:4597 stop:5952 length:1356 start_codon:yes stop_codon:yes gene_type:complete
MFSETFFGDDAWKTPKQQFMVKMSSANLEYANKTINGMIAKWETFYITNVNTTNTELKFEIANYKFKFTKSSKKAGMSDGGTTQQQELASLWMIEKALGSNSRLYKDVDDLKNDKNGFTELVKIYPNLETNTKWIRGLIAQQQTIGKKLKKGNYNKFVRDGGFMEYITKLVKNKFGISKKDSWNPADIWVVRNESEVIKIIDDALKGGHSQIQELNSIMMRLWEDRKLKGISLKAVSGNEAKWEEVNVKKSLFTEGNKPPVFEFKSAMIKLDLKQLTPKTKIFSTQDSVIIIGEGAVEYKFQVKMNDRGFSNLKFEPSQKGAAAARLGKVPLPMLTTMLQGDYKLNFDNANRNFPHTKDEFINKVDIYSKMWTNIHKAKVETNINKVEDFVTNMKTVFDTEPFVANSKLMQLNFLNEIFSLTETDRNRLLTDMVFLAMKKGEYFGPFGKLY